MRMKGRLSSIYLTVGLLCVLSVPVVLSHVGPGAVLQLLSYETEAAPSPINGDIVPDGQEDKWRSAYVRSITFADPGGTVTLDGNVLITSDADYLYIGVGFNSTSAGNNNYARIYLDLDHDHALDGSASTPGEYYAQLTGSGPSVADNGGYFGSNQWQSYGGVLPVGFEAVGEKHGTGSPNTWNFEFKIPLQGGTGPSGESFPNVAATDEVGILIEVFDSPNGTLFWEPTGRDVLDASTWGEILLGIRSPERNISGSISLGHDPTIDGNVSSDPAWQHYTTSSRRVEFANYDGQFVNATLLAKTNASDAYIGLIMDDTSASAGDQLNIYFDYNASTGGDLDYILTHLSEDGASVAFSGAYDDTRFESSPAWTADAAANGAGVVGHNGSDYEFEFRVPLAGSGGEDLQVVLGALLGMNLEYVDAGSGDSYWMIMSANSNNQKLRVDASSFTALGWLRLQTGAPVIQPVYPRSGDDVSGHYPFMIYTTSLTGEDGIVSAEFSDDQGVSWKALERTDETGVWTKSWDTTVLPDGLREIRIRATDSASLTAVEVFNVVIDNIANGPGDQPTVVINSPEAGSYVNGNTEIIFTVTPAPGQTILNTEIAIDGGSWVTTTSPYTWDTATESDGSHIFQVRALQSDSLSGQSNPRLVLTDNAAPEIEDLSVAYPEGQIAAKAGDALLITVFVRDDDAGLDATSVMLNSNTIDNNTHLMVDDGTNGDVVPGDNVHSYAVTVTSTTTGSTALSVTAADVLGNASGSIATSVDLDNTPPSLSIVVLPTPSGGALSGEVYVDHVVLDGAYADVPNSDGVVAITIHHRNSDGDDVNDSPISVPADSDNFSRTIRLIEGTNNIETTVTDGAGLTTTQTASLDFVVPETSVSIGPEGGVVMSPDGSSITIPAGALQSTVNISITRIPADAFPPSSDPRVTLLKLVRAFEPDGLVLHKPAEVVLTYTDADLDRNQNGSANWPEQSLEAFFWDGFRWVMAGQSKKDSAGNTLTFQVNHLGILDIGAVSSPVSGVDKVYWTRNPLVPDEGSTLVFEMRSSGQLTLKIYDLSGQLVRTIVDRERVGMSGSFLWDGLNDFDRFIGSGVYVYVLNFVGDDGHDVTVRKPLGVVQ